MEKNLKYIGYGIALQEVPDEISLVFNISNCPHRCKGCHSEYLWEDTGEDLMDTFQDVIKQYEENITCVCFMGGDQDIKQLKIILEYIKNLGYKTCVYSGSDDFDLFKDCLPYLDWLKIGSYKEELTVNNNIQYGIKLATSNQKMYKSGTDY